MRLPIGIQDFYKLRTEGYVYVDKTREIHRIINQAPYLFLSRPRRFGKSLLVATMAELFRNRKELFEGLWIYDHWDWDAPPAPNHPHGETKDRQNNQPNARNAPREIVTWVEHSATTSHPSNKAAAATVPVGEH